LDLEGDQGPHLVDHLAVARSPCAWSAITALHRPPWSRPSRPAASAPASRPTRSPACCSASSRPTPPTPAAASARASHLGDPDLWAETKHALTRAVAGARLIGGRALVVHAIDEQAAAFWRRRGFLPSNDDPLTLIRSLPDIAASLQSAI
jgi:hypothetical protein